MTDGQILSSRLGAVLFVALLVMWIPAVSMSVVADTAPSGPAADDSPNAEDSTNTSEAAEEAVQAQLALARDVQTILEDESRSNREAALDAADMALATRQSQASERQVDTGMASRLGTQRTNVRGARAILNIMNGTQSGKNSETVRLAETGVKLQVAQLSQSDRPIAPSNVDLPDIETPAHESPSAALFALLGQNSNSLTAAEASDIRALDDLPEPTRSELTDVIDAYIAYKTVTRELVTDINRTQLRTINHDWTRMEHVNSDVKTNAPKVRAAQVDLLESAEDLDNALSQQDSPSLAGTASHSLPCSTINCNITDTTGIIDNNTGISFFINLHKHDNNYSQNYNLLIDRGGNDEYNNNAGGAGITNSAALIDLQGTDKYFGRNGGANAAGAGFLFDNGNGDDNYTAGGDRTNRLGFGTNGGATQFGQAFLVDAGGSDEYFAGSNGTNGGGRFVGRGLLVDAGTQNDTYDAHDDAVNGGARFQGAGILIDAGGQGGDVYRTTKSAPYRIGADPGGGTQGGNGGGTNGGVGFLLDAGTQRDEYKTGSNATNGGGRFLGVGFLLDTGGDDDYLAESGDTTIDGVNGGGWTAGIGTLLDLGGSDEYKAISSDESVHGVNGGASGLSGTNTVVGTFGFEPSTGMLVDVGTMNDEYTAFGAGDVRGANGGGHFLAQGMLVDSAGTDTYNSTSATGSTNSSNGGSLGSFKETFVFLVPNITNISVPSVPPVTPPISVPASGLLLDVSGVGDTYIDGRCGTETDDVVLPKGFAGAQLDNLPHKFANKYRVGCGKHLFPP